MGFHATTVRVGGKGVMIIGPSGSGKSGLALQLIGLGAQLISDDYSRIEIRNARPFALAPERLQGVIEARGVGLINVPWVDDGPIDLVVDMEKAEPQRLPHSSQMTAVAGCKVPLVLRVDAPYFPSSIYNLLLHGKYDPESKA
jgi:HPr kinase/phosphorylase